MEAYNACEQILNKKIYGYEHDACASGELFVSMYEIFNLGTVNYSKSSLEQVVSSSTLHLDSERDFGQMFQETYLNEYKEIIKQINEIKKWRE